MWIYYNISSNKAMAKKGELSMILSEEWTQHIDRFIVELTRNFYTPLADLSLEYFERCV